MARKHEFLAVAIDFNVLYQQSVFGSTGVWMDVAFGIRLIRRFGQY